jgi:hypothetical protein
MSHALKDLLDSQNPSNEGYRREQVDSISVKTQR